MIKTKNLQKHFNKGKMNHVHVIDSNSMELPEVGLVALFGNSGSGKTTLLNVIGGLDSVESGTIVFDDTEINHYRSKVWDKIRANDIGYIFQNYYLLENKTVKENIEFVLTMIGIVDEIEVNHRINYVLHAVGMFRFRNKLAGELSGGQQQRVAIARAIVKNPKVVIADEPTGNLDSKNSLEVMRIIKEISKERLVVLVTHESNLAHHYADRVIEVVDGRVHSDELNDSNVAVAYQYDDRDLYLGDLTKVAEHPHLEIYSDKSEKDLKIKVVSVNGLYYLKTNESLNLRILTDSSEIKIFEGNRSTKENSPGIDTSFSLKELESHSQPRVKKRTISFKEGVISAFRKLFSLGKKTKFQIFALVLLGAMIGGSVHVFMSNLNPDYSVITYDPDVYEVRSDSKYPNYFEIETSLSENGSLYFLDNDQYKSEFNMQFPGNGYIYFNESPTPLSVLAEKDVIHGKYPENSFEILIDVSYLMNDKEINTNFHTYGITTAKELVGETIYYHDILLTISGVVSKNSRSIYLDDQIMKVQRREAESLAVLGESKIELIQGKLPTYQNNDTFIECLIDETRDYNMGDSIYSNVKINGKNYDFIVVGQMKSTPQTELMDLHVFMDDYQFLESYTPVSQIFIHTKNEAKLTEVLSSLGLTYTNQYQNHYEQIKEDNNVGMISSLTTIAILIVVSCILFFFLVRSSLTSRTREISILRALGVSKSEVSSVYLLEYLILTVFTSLIGLVIGTIVVMAVENSFFGDIFTMRVTFLSTIIGIVLLFVSNIFISMIPITALLRKTPAKMLTSSDI